MDKICGLCKKIDTYDKLDYTHYYCKSKRTYVDITDFPDRCYDFSLDTSICGSCIEFDWNNQESYATRFRCDGICRYVSPWDKQCYCNHKSNSSNTNNSDNSFTQSGCYITTIFCNILGYPDDCELLNLLRMFRENILKCDFKYIDLLLQYDMIGPEISHKIMTQENNYSLALNLNNYFLIPCAKMIKEGFISEAIKIYENMVKYLCETFNIALVKPNRGMQYDYTILGKGRQRLKENG